MTEALFRFPPELNVEDGHASDNFRKWKRELEVFMFAAGHKKKDDDEQVNIILNCAGTKTIEAYDQFT